MGAIQHLGVIFRDIPLHSFGHRNAGSDFRNPDVLGEVLHTNPQAISKLARQRPMIDLFGNDTPTPQEATGIREAARIRAHSTGSESAGNQRTAVAKPPREKLPRTPMDAIEQGIVRKLQANVTFVPASSHKRFVRDLNPEKSQLSDNGRAYLAYIANRYRRQWKATHEEFCWIVQWCRYGALPEVRGDGVLGGSKRPR